MNKTSDLWFGSYLILKGYDVKSHEKVGKKVFFIFEIDDTKWEELKFEFFNSDLSQIKLIQEKLKDLILN